MIKKGIQLNNRKLVNTIFYADDHILMATSEDDLQTTANHLNLIARKYKMTISSTKNKINGYVGEPHTKGKNCAKRQYY